MPDTAALIRRGLATGAIDAWQGLDLALAAAYGAGRRAIRGNEHFPPVEQLSLALRAADEALEGLALELAGDQGGPDVEARP
jgi:hypothetical protein